MAVRLTPEEKERKIREDNEYLQNLEKSTKTEDGVYELKYTVCIPTYNNRKPSLLDHLDQFGNSKVYVFIYESQVDMYTWLDRPNVTKVIVPDAYLNIQRMRLFIQNYMGDEKYWVTDDDLRGVMIAPDKHKIGFAHGLKMLEVYSEGKGFSAVAYNHVDISTKMWTCGLHSSGYASVTVLFDGKIINKAGLKYSGDVNVSGDIEFVINSHLLGIPVTVCRWGLLDVYEQTGGKTTVASSLETHLNRQEYLYIKYGDYVSIDLENRRWYCGHVKYNRLGGEKTYNEELLELCKKHDHEALKQYLLDKKAEKDEEKRIKEEQKRLRKEAKEKKEQNNE